MDSEHWLAVQIITGVRVSDPSRCINAISANCEYQCREVEGVTCPIGCQEASYHLELSTEPHTYVTTLLVGADDMGKRQRRHMDRQCWVVRGASPDLTAYIVGMITRVKRSLI